MVYKYNFIRDECIGCSACAACNPEYWEMADDAKSVLLNSEEVKEDIFEIDFDEDKLDLNMETAESCPVNCIHIYDDDKKLI